jgi:hypothetical protein
VAHNDHLQQPVIERKRGAAKGIYYTGIALTGPDFIVIASNLETLREKWAMFSEQPLNEGKCAEVGLFSVQDIKELPSETATPPQ